MRQATTWDWRDLVQDIPIYISPLIYMIYMGRIYQDGKHEKIVSLFMVTWSQNEPSESWDGISFIAT